MKKLSFMLAVLCSGSLVQASDWFGECSAGEVFDPKNPKDLERARRVAAEVAAEYAHEERAWNNYCDMLERTKRYELEKWMRDNREVGDSATLRQQEQQESLPAERRCPKGSGVPAEASSSGPTKHSKQVALLHDASSIKPTAHEERFDRKKPYKPTSELTAAVRHRQQKNRLDYDTVS